MPATTRFAHQMPFGATVLADGSTWFRFHAPAQPEVALVLEPSGTALPMTRRDDGWFELITDRAPAGTQYRYRLADGLRVPDPASRCQADDAHGPSVVVDPMGYGWQTGDWPGRPWQETVLYELHTGTFSPEGTFDGVLRKLDYLAGIGVTAVELMPVADFPGRRGWGYDGVLLFAPDRAYGSPDDLKRLVDEAHARNLMVFMDVVYNHFGPDGNYLHLYAPDFFTERHHTPWGAAIDFGRRVVRDFYVHNALYWLEEYRFDGLRFDAVHAILDDSETHILTEIAETVHHSIGAGRHAHLVLENDSNESRFLDRGFGGSAPWYVAQWNDDYHHVQHVLLTGENDGYYRDYADRPIDWLGRVLTEGFAYQGEPSPYRDDEPRGEPSAHLPALAFVNFIQNHDQVGNRGYGERLSMLVAPEKLRAGVALMLLGPGVPLLFMGEEWGAEQPFLYFCDFHGELGEAVRKGRREEFVRFEQFADPKMRETIPDPNADETFETAKLNWPGEADDRAQGWLAYYSGLLGLRREAIVPRLSGTKPGAGQWQRWNDRALTARWQLNDGSTLILLANLADTPAGGCDKPDGLLIFETHPGLAEAAARGTLPAWSVAWFVAGPPPEA
jgi:malto-oligosyltrehalose trehalohydrolase